MDVFRTSVALIVDALDVIGEETAAVLESMEPLLGGIISSAVPAHTDGRNPIHQIHSHHTMCPNRLGVDMTLSALV